MADPSTPPPAAPGRPHAALRWLLVLLIGVGGAWAVQRAVRTYQARAMLRLALRDWARFEGCLLGVPPPPEADAADRVTDLALGTGDPVWPHTCAMALGRMVREVDRVAAEDPAARPLLAAAEAMESAVGAAEFWAERVRRGAHEAPAWIGAYIALRRATHAYAARRGVAVPPAEAPHRRRRPRQAGDPLPEPLAVPLPGGDEADLVDAVATPVEAAVLLRDRRSRYTVCRVALAPGEATPARCAPMPLPAGADPRDARFVPSARGAHLALWARAPRSERALVAVEDGSVRLSAAGRPDPERDFWVGDRAAMALEIEGGVATLKLAPADGPTRAWPLPAGLDVLTEERALLGLPAGAAAVLWLDARDRDRAVLRALPLEATAPGAVREVARWREPRLTGIDRRLLPCGTAGGPAWVLAGDARGATLFVGAETARFVRGPELGRGIDRRTRVLCDARGVAVVQTAALGPLEPYFCDAARCAPGASLPVAGDAGAARVDGALVVADGGGADGALRVRRLDPASGRLEPGAVAERLSAARAVRVVAHGTTVALFVAASQTYALVSRDGGRTFASARLAP